MKKFQPLENIIFNHERHELHEKTEESKYFGEFSYFA